MQGSYGKNTAELAPLSDCSKKNCIYFPSIRKETRNSRVVARNASRMIWHVKPTSGLIKGEQTCNRSFTIYAPALFEDFTCSRHPFLKDVARNDYHVKHKTEPRHTKKRKHTPTRKPFTV